MLRFRFLTNARDESNRATIAAAQNILRAQFPGLDPGAIDTLPEQLENPLKYRFRCELIVAERSADTPLAVAVLLFAPDLRFAFLDLISTAPGRGGGGVGAALYQRVREEALGAGARGLYLECLPDDPALSPDTKTRRQNVARLRFYERFDARPIAGTAYETPLSPDACDPPYLVFDGLGRFALPSATRLRRIVRAILERKYGELCPPAYIAAVLRSIRPATLALRAPRYIEATKRARGTTPAWSHTLAVIVNSDHDIHHVRERGYVEAPARVAAILTELERHGLVKQVAKRRFGERHIRAVHDPALVDYVRRACAEQPAGKSLYPYVFPIRNPSRMPRERSVLAGYWCIDTFTPLNRNAWPAARGAIDCALTAAALVSEGAPAAYALVRPPGHHAERRAFGGFCYFNNAAVAAHYLSAHGRVAVLDLDYHHGNGTQDIFYERADVLTVSVHAHPSFAYPYFTGFANETGRGAGAGYNLNLPLPERLDPARYRETVARALKRVARHRAEFLVLALGFDTAKEDPTGTWSNSGADFRALGEQVAAVALPTVIVQEGGYRVRTLGSSARAFFTGFLAGLARTPRQPRAAPVGPAPTGTLTFRDAVQVADVAVIGEIVTATGNFNAAEIAIARELAEERIARGAASGYEFIFAEAGGQVLGYACYGPIPGTERRFDLYWVAVDPRAQRANVGRELLSRTERAVRAAGGERIFIDTSTSTGYAAARGFYARMGYAQIAVLPDFYANGDSKVIFSKTL